MLETSSITVTYDATAAVYQIAGTSAPTGAISLDNTGLTTDVTVVAVAGGDLFKVFQTGPENAIDRIIIEGSTGADDYRVSTIESIGLDGAGQTSLRFEQLNGQQSAAGTLLSHVIVDVFDLDLTDYVRLDTLAGDDQLDATAVIDPVVSHLYLYGGADDDSIVGSEAAGIADVIVGGTGSDRLTGGPGVDLFYEQDEQNDANEPGATDTLVETRDANFWLSDTSLRIDDTGLHDQYGDEPETFADVFEAVELYGLDGANRFEIANWSDSGVLDGYKGGDTYILELSTSVAGQQFFNINDTGASGIDTLEFRGSSGGDTIQLDTVYVPAEDLDGKFTDARWTEFGNHGDGLLIGHFNATSTGYDQKNLDDEDQLMQVSASALTAGDNYQVVNYFTIEQVTLFGGEGNDKFISDSTSAKIDVFGNAGDDQFYIGSVLETEDVLVEGQIVTIVKQITDGATFNGTAYYGGDDDDYFEVNHNVADINLFGDNGDDTFLVKALLTIDEDGELLDLESKTATVSGTFGENSSTGSDTSTDTGEVDIDTLVYVENANIAIDGGAGFDAVSLVGTVLSDTFYVYVELDPETNRPVQRIFGAGVKLQKLLNIERLQLLAGGGDDTIYLYGTDMGTIGDMVIKGGSGSDTIYVGGDAEIITQSFPKNSDQFYSTVEGFDVPKDATGKFVRAGEVDGMPFYTVRDVARIVPFVVENPARTVTRTMPTINDLTPFRSPVLVEGGEGLDDRVVFNFAGGTPDLTLRDVELYKKDVTFDETKIALASLAGDPLTDLPAILLASTGSAGLEAQQLLGNAATNYLRFRDRYYEPTLLSSLQALTGAATQQVTIPAGIGYFNIQTKLENGQVVTARSQLIDFATTFGLTLQWQETDHPDPSRSDKLYELLSINKNGTPVAFEALHSETVVLSGNTKTIIKDLTAVTLKTTAPLQVTVSAGAVTDIQIVRTDALNTLSEPASDVQFHFSSIDTVDLLMSDTAETELVVDNGLFTGRLHVQGGSQADSIRIERNSAETVVDGNHGDDVVTIGQAGSLDHIGGALFLFGGQGADQILVDDANSSVARDLQIDKNLLQHNVGFEQLSRITSALGLKNITSEEDGLLEAKLEVAAVPYGQAAMNVDASDLTAYRDFAAELLLAELENGLSGLQGELDTSIQRSVDLLRERSSVAGKPNQTVCAHSVLRR